MCSAGRYGRDSSHQINVKVVLSVLYGACSPSLVLSPNSIDPVEMAAVDLKSW